MSKNPNEHRSNKTQINYNLSQKALVDGKMIN